MATIFIDIKIKICINSDIFKVIVDIQDIRLHYGIVEGFYNINGQRKNTACNLPLCQIYEFIGCIYPPDGYRGIYPPDGYRGCQFILYLKKIYQFIITQVWAGEDTERTIAVYMQNG